jgi:hypothetical protein
MLARTAYEFDLQITLLIPAYPKQQCSAPIDRIVKTRGWQARLAADLSRLE